MSKKDLENLTLDEIADIELTEDDMEISEDCVDIKNDETEIFDKVSCSFEVNESNEVKLVAYYDGQKKECMCVPSTDKGEIDFDTLAKTFGMFSAKHGFRSIIVEDERLNRWIAEDLFEV